jgi:hypothetical protein
MATVIRFTDSHSLERGLGIFRRHGDAVPASHPDMFYVSDRIVALLKRKRIPFESIEPAQYGLMQVTEDMFASLRQAAQESRQGHLTTIRGPLSVKKLAKIAREKGLT